MALHEFWSNVKAAGSALFHESQTETVGLGSTSPDRYAAHATLWLTPAAVAGFDAADFSFMPPARREELRNAVEAFRRAAENTEKEPSSVEHVDEALRNLKRIWDLLQLDAHDDLEALRIAEILKNVHFEEPLSSSIAELRHSLDIDSSGDPAVWIWVIVDDEAAKRERFFEHTATVRQSIQSALRRHGVRRWPYIHFRTVSEQKDLDERKSE